VHAAVSYVTPIRVSQRRHARAPKFSTFDEITSAFGTVTSESDAVRTRVLRKPTSSTVPCTSPSFTKSPT
jgi:hypothetical protein